MANNDIIQGFDDEKDGGLKLRLEVCTEYPKTMIVRGTGYIDTYNTMFFLKKTELVRRKGYKNFILDITGVTYMSSTGIGSLTSILKQVRPEGGELIIVGVQPKVFEVLQLLGFAQFFTIKDGVEMAIQSLGKNTLNPTFPASVVCPICSKKMKATKAGKFRCPECKTVLAIDNAAKVFLG